MDTSELYIKMSDCPEIQEQWNPESGDWIAEYYQRQWDVSMAHMCNIFELKRDKNRVIMLTYEGWDTFNSYEKPVWLPSQDQIQEMMAKELKYSKIDNNFLYDSLCDLYQLSSAIDVYNICQTWEQLWLAFYMHEKHGKLWDGKKWIKEE